VPQDQLRVDVRKAASRRDRCAVSLPSTAPSILADVAALCNPCQIEIGNGGSLRGTVLLAPWNRFNDRASNGILNGWLSSSKVIGKSFPALPLLPDNFLIRLANQSFAGDQNSAIRVGIVRVLLMSA